MSKKIGYWSNLKSIFEYLGALHSTDAKDHEKMTKVDSSSHNDFIKIPAEYDTPRGVFFRNIISSTLNNLIDRGSRNDAMEAFQAVSSKIENSNALAVRAFYDLKYILDPFYLKADKPLTNHMTEAQGSVYTNPTQSFDNLLFIKNYFLSLQKIRSSTVDELKLTDQISQILNQLLPYRHKNSSQHKTVEGVIKNLPGEVIRGILYEQYPDILKIGSADQHKFFEELTSGKWPGVIQAYLIKKNLNFLLNSEMEYSYRRAKTLMSTRERERDNADSVLASISRPDEIMRWDLSQIEAHPDAAMALLSRVAKDEQYMYGNRVMHKSPRPQKPIEKKVTFIYYDISGSMAGDKARIQASAIAAVVDMALSEKDPFGNPIHQVVLVPFGDTVYQGVTVSDAVTAKRVVLEYLATETSSNTSTYFQPVFDHFFKTIHKHSKTKKSGSYADMLSLKKANMILITDGGAYDLQLDKIKNDIANLPKEVAPFFNLVSLGGRNESLESIVGFLNKEHAAAMVTAITTEMMGKFIKESTSIHVDPNAFVYEPSKGVVPSDVMRQLMGLKLPRTNTTEAGDVGRQLKKQVRVLESNTSAANVTVLSELQKLTVIFQTQTIPADIRITTLAEVLSNFQNWTGRSLSQLSLIENDIIGKFIEATENGPK